MAEQNNNRFGLLFLFDLLALIIGTFGTALLLPYFMDGVIDTSLLILFSFFFGIKLVIIGIGDLFGITKKIWAAALAVIIANALIVGFALLMSFGIPKLYLAVNAAADLVLVLIAHLIWAAAFGHGKSKSDEAARPDDNTPDVKSVQWDDTENIFDPMDEDAYALSADDDTKDFQDLFRSIDSKLDAGQPVFFSDETEETPLEEAVADQPVIAETAPEQPESELDFFDEEDLKEFEPSPYDDPAQDFDVFEEEYYPDEPVANDGYYTAADDNVDQFTEDINEYRRQTEGFHYNSDAFDDLEATIEIVKAKLSDLILKKNIVESALKDLLLFSEQLNEKFDKLEEREQRLNALERQLSEKARELHHLEMQLNDRTRQLRELEQQLQAQQAAASYQEASPIQPAAPAPQPVSAANDEVITDDGDYDIIADPKDLEIIRSFLKSRSAL